MASRLLLAYLTVLLGPLAFAAAAFAARDALTRRREPAPEPVKRPRRRKAGRRPARETAAVPG